MPRKSLRAKALHGARTVYSLAKGLFVLDHLMENDDFDLELPSFLGVLHSRARVRKISKRRYMKRDKYLRSGVNIFHLDLEVCKNGLQWQKNNNG